MRSVKDTFILQEEQNINTLKKHAVHTWSTSSIFNDIISSLNASIFDVWEQISIVSDSFNITYKELHIISNCIANMFSAHGIHKNDRVAIVSGRSIEAILSMIGILKLGAAYIPIDSKMPEERIQYILHDCKPQYVLNFTGLDLKIENEMTEEDLYQSYRYSPNFAVENISGDDIAYILYTSGTTGYPKGTLVMHKGVVNLCTWFNNQYYIKRNKNILHMTNLSFDVSVEEIFGALLNRGTLYIISENDKIHPNKFYRYLLKNKINIAQFVPTTLNFLLGEQPRLPDLEIIICGGEKLDLQTKKNILNKGYRLFNHYGPTETTVDAITCEATLENDIIGKPILNTKVYILDEFRNPVQSGEIGEICISGPGVSKGYLGKEKLTKEKFIMNPFEPGQVMYCTGDKGKFDGNHNIIYCGRFDEQIKINGVRIEMGDIESNILRYNGIRSVAVVLKENNDLEKYLCAYFTANHEINPKVLKAFCQKSLPLNMLPKHFIQLDKMPLTVNEKIDKNKLKLLPTERNKATPMTKASTDLQKQVLGIWSRVLIRDGISLNDIFIEIGGDSLKAAKLSAELENKLSVLIPLTLILDDTFSVHTCCNIILDSENRSNKQGNIVLLNKINNLKQNLFFIHGGNGEPGAFIEMSSLIHNYNCWGFRADVLDNFAPTNITINEIAERYMMQLKQIQPEGPYHIIGWCIGGSIAFELALQLEKQGEEVKFLALVNTFAPDREFWGEVQSFNCQTEIEEAKKFLPNLEKDIYDQKTLKDIWDKVLIEMKDRIPNTADFKKLVYDDMDRAIPDFENKDITIANIIYYINILRTFDNARALYTPSGTVKAHCYFFKAVSEAAANINLWNHYFIDPIECIDIKGNNFTVWKYPHVNKFAIKLQNVLERE